jgi:hypothetical protein
MIHSKLIYKPIFRFVKIEFEAFRAISDGMAKKARGDPMDQFVIEEYSQSYEASSSTSPNNLFPPVRSTRISK